MTQTELDAKLGEALEGFIPFQTPDPVALRVLLHARGLRVVCAEPVGWYVLDNDGHPDCTIFEDCQYNAHQRVNDRIANGDEELTRAVVRPAYAAPSEPGK